MSPQSEPRPSSSAQTSAAGAVAGLLAGTAAVAVSEAVAALVTGVTSPLFAVANRAVDAAPRPVKEWAIETFGTADKPVLIGGVVGAVAFLAAVAGLLGVRRPRVAVAMLLALSAVAAVAALTDRAASAGAAARLLPVAALVSVGLAGLALLLRAFRPATRPSSGASPSRASPSRASSSRASSSRASSSRAPSSRASSSRALSTREPAPYGRADAPVDAGAPGAEWIASSEGSKPRLRPAGDDLPPSFDRRVFLVSALAVGGVAAAGGLVARSSSAPQAAATRAALAVPVADVAAPALDTAARLDVPGITPYLTPNRDFYRVDTALRVPDVPVDTWRLRIHGLVNRELDLSFEDLLDRRLVECRITLTCVSNPVGGEYVGNATWIGVPVRDLLREAGVQGGADAVRSTSADDFTAGTPLSVLIDDDRDALLALAMNGEPLPLEHGFPVRMVTPGLYGYVSATKWLTDLEVTRFADFEAYWTTRGYAAEAPIKTSSRIDVPHSFARVRPGTVPVAGVAWAQDRGIRSVEVRVDGGPWNRARLAAEDNIDTWRQWVWQWEATPGNHRLEVRATDAGGYTQTAERAPIAPDGSTGWHSVSVTVDG